MSSDAPPKTAEILVSSAPAPPDVRVEVAGRTHPGRVRTNNEDNFLVTRLAKSMHVLASSLDDPDSLRSTEEGYLLVVADGMGGAAAGERASALAVRTVEAFTLNALKWFLHLDDGEERELYSELRRSLQRADRNIFREVGEDPKLDGMGTTLTMAYSFGTDLYLVHAGDSRAYLYRDGGIEQLTHDHTLVQLLVDGGALTPEAARSHRRRNVVTNVIGGPRPGVHAEVVKVQLQDGDTLLLCTDGLTEPARDPEIAAALADAACPDDACRRLIDLALDRGAPDNVTVVVARYQIAEKP